LAANAGVSIAAITSATDAQVQTNVDAAVLICFCEFSRWLPHYTATWKHLLASHLRVLSSSTLANVTYVTSTNPVDLGAVTPLDAILELSVTPGTVSGNKQVLLFIQVSLDGTNCTYWTHVSVLLLRINLIFFSRGWVLFLVTLIVQLKRSHLVLRRLSGFCPRYFKPVVFNDSGAALSAGTLNYLPVTGVGT